MSYQAVIVACLVVIYLLLVTASYVMENAMEGKTTMFGIFFSGPVCIVMGGCMWAWGVVSHWISWFRRG